MMSLVDAIGKERAAQDARFARMAQQRGPTSQPPGNAAPRYIGLRDGDLVYPEAQRLPFWLCVAALFIAVWFFAGLVTPQAAPDLTGIITTQPADRP